MPAPFTLVPLNLYLINNEENCHFSSVSAANIKFYMLRALIFNHTRLKGVVNLIGPRRFKGGLRSGPILPLNIQSQVGVFDIKIGQPSESEVIS